MSVVHVVPRTDHHQVGKASSSRMRDIRKMRENVTYAAQNGTASVETILEVELNQQE